MAKENCIISLQNVTKTFGNITVVNDVNLDITKGEFVTILGPSGCGKTTTLRMIAGFEIASSGKILLNNEDITKIPPHKRPINTVFQRYALFPYLDVYDNIAFGLKLKKIPYEVKDRKGNTKIKYKHLSNKEIDQKVAKALKVVDLEEMEDRDISTLSGGQQQRVAIARAIVNEPEILLLDEPLGALDLKMRKEMQLELKEMHKKLGITFIYVTHDQEEALTMSDTIVVMKRGEIQQIGAPIDIYNNPINAYVANFIGESNIYNSTITGKKKVTFLKHEFSCEDNFPLNEKVDVVIRPEDIVLKKIKEDKGDGKLLIGKIASKLFKGVHYQYVVMVGKSEVVCQDTKDREVGDLVSIEIEAHNIQIMKKDVTTNSISDAWINNRNQVVLSEHAFDCDVTQLLKGSKLDESGYLIDKEEKRYDLNDADVLAEIPFDAIELSDQQDDEKLSGKIINNIYKGDHYQTLVRTAGGEDFLVDTIYTWNEGDRVWLSIDKNKIKLIIKGDINKYVKE